VPLLNNHLSDEELIEHYQATGDKQAVGELFKRHSLMCFAVCNKYYRDTEKASDAAMAVFEKLFTDLQTHTIKNFKSWLHTVCRNQRFQFIRTEWTCRCRSRNQRRNNIPLFVQNVQTSRSR